MITCSHKCAVITFSPHALHSELWWQFLMVIPWDPQAKTVWSVIESRVSYRIFCLDFLIHIGFFGGGRGGGRSMWVTAAMSCTSTQHTPVSVYTRYGGWEHAPPPPPEFFFFFFFFFYLRLQSETNFPAIFLTTHGWHLMCQLYKVSSFLGEDSRTSHPLYETLESIKFELKILWGSRNFFNFNTATIWGHAHDDAHWYA